MPFGKRLIMTTDRIRDRNQEGVAIVKRPRANERMRLELWKGGKRGNNNRRSV